MKKRLKKKSKAYSSVLWIVFDIGLLLFLFHIGRQWTIWISAVSGGLLFLRWVTGPFSFRVKKD